MSMRNIEDLKYPIGQFTVPEEISNTDIEKWIDTIEKFPQQIATEVSKLSDEELLYKYRPNGWSIKQVLNHCIDSHTNSVMRFKLALTEENPVIRPYDEAAWAELSDTLDYKIEDSISLLKQVHQRWVFLLKSITPEHLNRTFIHPDGNDIISLKENLGIYAWHCQHHLHHIINAKKMKF